MCILKVHKIYCASSQFFCKRSIYQNYRNQQKVSSIFKRVHWSIMTMHLEYKKNPQIQQSIIQKKVPTQTSQQEQMEKADSWKRYMLKSQLGKGGSLHSSPFTQVSLAGHGATRPGRARNSQSIQNPLESSSLRNAIMQA